MNINSFQKYISLAVLRLLKAVFCFKIEKKKKKTYKSIFKIEILVTVHIYGNNSLYIIYLKKENSFFFFL